MTLRIAVSLVCFGHCLAAQTPVGVFTAQSDVGRARGAASYDPQQQTYQITGSGPNMWDTRDDFHFLWKRMTGNFILSTRARFLGRGVEEHRKLGWAHRSSVDPTRPQVPPALR